MTLVFVGRSAFVAKYEPYVESLWRKYQRYGIERRIKADPFEIGDCHANIPHVDGTSR